MVVISELARIRADGRVIDARMTLDRMIGLGWEPSKVIEVCWRWEGELLRLANHLGLLVMVAPDRQHLAVLWNHDAEGLDATLYVVAGDKRKFTRVPGELMINGNAEAVTYLWFGACVAGYLHLHLQPQARPRKLPGGHRRRDRQRPVGSAMQVNDAGPPLRGAARGMRWPAPTR